MLSLTTYDEPLPPRDAVSFTTARGGEAVVDGRQHAQKIEGLPSGRVSKAGAAIVSTVGVVHDCS